MRKTQVIAQTIQVSVCANQCTILTSELQKSSCLIGPMHPTSPGKPLMQVRFLNLRPPPHWTGQEVHDSQLLQAGQS